MIACKVVRFVRTVSLPGTRTTSTVSMTKPEDQRDFVIDFDPRLRMVFVAYMPPEQQRRQAPGPAKVMAFPMEQVEHVEFEPESYAAFREPKPAGLESALGERRKATAAAK